MPVYALGGIVPSDLEQGMSCGAHGIAMVRGSWGNGEKPQDSSV
jgi:thiamine monophosphate synthase